MAPPVAVVTGCSSGIGRATAVLLSDRVIHRALTARRPRARYIATPDARLVLAIMPRLSDRKRDALWARLLGLRDGEHGGADASRLAPESG